MAQSASDIDVVLAQGYGFPRWVGCPVFWARQQDRACLELDVQQFALTSGVGFRVADLVPLLNA